MIAAYVEHSRLLGALARSNGSALGWSTLNWSTHSLCITKVGERPLEINSNNLGMDCNYDEASH